MTAITQEPAAEPPARTPYDTRLVTFVTRDVRRRLDIQAAVERRPINHVLNEVLDQSLLTSAELAERVRAAEHEVRNDH
jgi:hypothetical protein